MPYRHVVYINCDFCNHLYIIAQMYRCVKYIISIVPKSRFLIFNFFCLFVCFMFGYVLPSCVLKLGWLTWLNLISDFLKASIFVNKSKKQKNCKHSNDHIEPYFASLVTLMFPLPNHLLFFKGVR